MSILISLYLYPVFLSFWSGKKYRKQAVFQVHTPLDIFHFPLGISNLENSNFLRELISRIRG